MFQCFCIEMWTARNLNELKTYCVGTHLSHNLFFFFSVITCHTACVYSQFMSCVIITSDLYIIANSTDTENVIQTGIRCNSSTNGSAVLEYAGCSDTTSIQYTQHAGRPKSYMSKFRNNLQTQNHFYNVSLSCFTAARDEIHKAPLHI